MAKKKLQKQEPVEVEELHGFLTFMEYFATGEGQTIELNFCYAADEKEAKEKHLDRFIGNNESARNYFGLGVDVMTIESKKAKDTLERIFQIGGALHKSLCKAGIEFHFKCYVNYT